MEVFQRQGKGQERRWRGWWTHRQEIMSNKIAIGQDKARDAGQARAGEASPSMTPFATLVPFP